MFDLIYLNFHSVGWAIALVFYWLSSLYCLTLPQKSKATLYLGIGFLFAGFTSIAYFLSTSIYHPYAAMHRYLTVFCILGLMMYTGQFLLQFPKPRWPRLSRVLLIGMWLVIVIITTLFIIQSRSARYAYDMNGHQWDFVMHDISQVTGLLVLIYDIIAVVISIAQIITSRGKDRLPAIGMAVIILLLTIIPAVANILSRNGITERETTLLLIVFHSVVGYFFVVILYINNTKDRTTFMTKIVGISLVTFLVIMLGLSYYTYKVKEATYDLIRYEQVPRILHEQEYRPNDLEYIVVYSFLKDRFSYDYKKGDISIDPKGFKYEFLNTMIREKIKNLSINNFEAELNELLHNTHPFFTGYKAAILSYYQTLPRNEMNRADKIVTHLDGLSKNIVYYKTMIERLPINTFSSSLKKLFKDKKDDFAPFKDAILAYLKTTTLTRIELRDEVLKYLAPMNPSLKRNSRRDSNDKYHYLSHIQVDLKENKIYDIGFSYLSFRRYIHPDSLMFIFFIGCILIVLLVGYRFFFLGALINPLKSLLGGLNQVSDGNLEIQIPIKVEDEIGFLTHNFNTMVATIRTAKKQIEDYTNNLEDKVKQRTAEVHTAMEELEAINEALVQTRDKLWGEMQIAKKIQTVLLPRNPSMHGYEITAYMEPAEDVGGDYYDIINCSNKDFLVIGDVSGHGVPAGLVMMMVQTCIKVTLDCNPSLSPKELLCAINRTITQNIIQMGEDKYMTITVLASIDQGKFTFSGLHQDIIVFRSEKKEVELIETEGIWLGIFDDIKDILYDNSLILNKGDTMLVYTDGIIEALEKDEKGREKMYGITKLSALIKECGKEPIDIIKTTIINSLSNYKCSDDVTFVLVRRVL